MVIDDEACAGGSIHRVDDRFEVVEQLTRSSVHRPIATACSGRTRSSSTVHDFHSSSQPSCSPCSLTSSPTFRCVNGVADVSASICAWVDFPAPGVPVSRITGNTRAWCVVIPSSARCKLSRLQTRSLLLLGAARLKYHGHVTVVESRETNQSTS